MKHGGAQFEVRSIPAGEFKAKCLKLMDEVHATQRGIIVTKRGKPVGQFLPMPQETKPFRSIFGRSPASRVPDSSEWKKLKSDWTEEWSQSSDKLARDFRRTKNGKP